MSQETYFLSSLDSIKFEATRTCIFLRKLRFHNGKDCALVKIIPPVIGQEYGLSTDIELLVLTNRHESEGLYPITEFSCFVFVTRPLVEDIESRGQIDKEDVQILAWGELYRTKQDADGHVFG